jgi:hypothetical protein
MATATSSASSAGVRNAAATASPASNQGRGIPAVDQDDHRTARRALALISFKLNQSLRRLGPQAQTQFRKPPGTTSGAVGQTRKKGFGGPTSMLGPSRRRPFDRLDSTQAQSTLASVIGGRHRPQTPLVHRCYFSLSTAGATAAGGPMPLVSSITVSVALGGPSPLCSGSTPPTTPWRCPPPSACPAAGAAFPTAAGAAFPTAAGAAFPIAAGAAA